jgi:hypothetical protein
MRLEHQPTAYGWAQLRNWLTNSKPPANLWLGKPCVIAAWLGLALALVTPPHGFDGIQLCWIQSITGIPCLGCGLTRSLSCGLHGMFAESWQYHPMGILILPLFLFTAIQSTMPESCRDKLKSFMQVRAAFFNSLYLIFILAFIGYGTSRAFIHSLEVPILIGSTAR